MSNSDASTETDGPGETWTLVDFTVGRDQAELAADILWSSGVVAIEERGHHDPDLIILRTSIGSDPASRVEALTTSMPRASFTFVEVDRSVADTWREFAVATWITDSHALVPSWIEEPPHGNHVRIEPLDQFGLGNHPTTVTALRLCMRHIDAGSTVFDLGTGSGVLAIALRKWKNVNALVHDIAPGSRDAVEMNLRLNGLDGLEWSHGYPNEPVDAVVANILAPVLIQEAAMIRASAPKGLIVLSGMRAEQSQSVLESFPAAVLLERHEMEGWTALALRNDD